MSEGMFRASGFLVAGVLAVLLSAGAALGANTVADAADGWERVRSIAPGRGVEVERFDSPRSKAKGIFVSASGDAVVVRQKDGSEMTIPRDQIRKVKLRGSRGKNTLLGLALGGGVGLVAGAIYDRGPSESGEGNLGKVILGGWGLILGSATGALLPPSKTIYEAPKRDPQPPASGRQTLRDSNQRGAPAAYSQACPPDAIASGE